MKTLCLGIALLLAVGCGCVNNSGKHGDTRDSRKLIKAIAAGNDEAALSFVAGGVNVNGQDSSGMTPLLQALLTGNRKLYERLLELGADPDICDQSGQCVMNLAAETEGAWLQNALKHGGDPNVINVGNPHFPGRTPIFYAIAHVGEIRPWRAQNSKVLIEAGAIVNHVDAKGTTLLASATFGENFEIVVQLLMAGAEIDLKSNSGLAVVERFNAHAEGMELVEERQRPWVEKAQELLIERGLLRADGKMP